MEQYVIQIQTEPNGEGVGWLAKSFEVSAECPVPSKVPSNRVQVILTNTTSFNGIVSVYRTHTTAAIFSYDESEEKIDCSGAVTNSWPID